MADSEPNQDFPSRAALRRARRAEEEAKRLTGHRGQEAAVLGEAEELDESLEFDEFDAIAESRAEDSDAEANGWVVPVTVDEPAGPATATSARTADGDASAEEDTGSQEATGPEDATGSGEAGRDDATGSQPAPGADPHPKSAVLRRLTAQARPTQATAAPRAGATSTAGGGVATLATSHPLPDEDAGDSGDTAAEVVEPAEAAHGESGEDAGTKHGDRAEAPATEAPRTGAAGTRTAGASTTAAGAVETSPAGPAPRSAAAPDAAEDLSTPEARRQALRAMGTIENRETFLRPDDEPAAPAERGFRGFLARMGFNVEPTDEEIQERKWRRAVGARLSSPRTVSVVNGKGGANKTPTAVLLAAVFGRNGADPVLAWDNNGTRGTLGWRTAKAAHDAHVMDLLQAAPDLMDIRVGDPVINDYVHHQPEDRYSVLRTDPTLLASEQHLTAEDFDTLHAVVEKFFRLAVVDSGNDESAERWMRMIDRTDQLVIATTTVEEHAEAGALLLEALAKRGGRYAELARNAVVVVSQQQQRGSKEQLGRIAFGFRRLARAVVTVPYDPALVKGPIRFEALRPATRHAWLEASAAVAAGLED